MTLNERDEIIREISAHIRDSAEESGVDVETILARLGSPEELASQYSDGLLIRQASRSISPLKLMRGALRLATKGISGVIVFFVGIFGYAMGGGMVLSGMIKPIFPAPHRHVVSGWTHGRVWHAVSSHGTAGSRSPGHVVHPVDANGGQSHVVGDHIYYPNLLADLPTLAGEAVAGRMKNWC